MPEIAREENGDFRALSSRLPRSADGKNFLTGRASLSYKFTGENGEQVTMEVFSTFE